MDGSGYWWHEMMPVSCSLKIAWFLRHMIFAVGVDQGGRDVGYMAKRQPKVCRPPHVSNSWFPWLP